MENVTQKTLNFVDYPKLPIYFTAKSPTLTLQNLKIPHIKVPELILYIIISTKIGSETMKSESLIVENDMYLQECLEELLKKESYEPTSAQNCVTVKDLFQEDTFDLRC